MRTKQDWMQLSQPGIDILPEWMWEHYENGGCVCHAYDKSECVCGAWWREQMCQNCMNQGCKYRGYNCDWHNPPEQFEWVKIDETLRELVCTKYQPDGVK